MPLGSMNNGSETSFMRTFLDFISICIQNLNVFTKDVKSFRNQRSKSNMNCPCDSIHIVTYNVPSIGRE